ncbi:hypothetical protein C8T65DRAFT_751106 [Cerioporus squamosus]|nr:hypothetical protein C8T65DRAFT_751106 [Cerioporus squamosus]
MSSFLNSVWHERCPRKDDATGVRCCGVPVLRPFKNKDGSYDGKKSFFGCSEWKKGESGHRFVGIRLDVSEELVTMLQKTNGQIKLSDNDRAIIGKCAVMVSRRKFTHVVNGQVETGKYKLRECPTRLRIWFPVNHMDMGAVVILEHPHNHPVVGGKVSHDAKGRYAKAVMMTGVLGATPTKVDQATSTSAIFDGQTLAEFEPDLGDKQIQRKIVRTVKQKHMPFGTGLLGVLEKQTSDHASLQPEEEYIHWVENGNAPIIVTFRVGLASLMHEAIEIFCDNTYKHVTGGWIEWEWACWDRRINQRFTILRAYTTRETRETSSRLWDIAFGAIAKARGCEVQFKMFSQDGSSLQAILVDGCKEQIDALGDYLVKRNIPTNTGINTMDPQEIVKYLVKLCHVHYDRNMDKLANKCNDEIMHLVRQVPHLETEAQLAEFKVFCHGTKNKALLDWLNDKERAPWFYATLNPNFSQMPREDWESTSITTNVNESSHTVTNQNTGIGLLLLEAIERARTYDTQVEINMQQARTSGVLANNLNTAQDRMTTAIRRKQKSTLKAIKRHGAEHTLYNLQDKLADAEEAKKATDANVKELREQLKAHRAATGVKSRRHGKATKGKLIADELADFESNQASGSGAPNREGLMVAMATIQGS